MQIRPNQTFIAIEATPLALVYGPTASALHIEHDEIAGAIAVRSFLRALRYGSWPVAELFRSESDNHLDAASRVRSVEQRTQPGVRERFKQCLIVLAALLGSVPASIAGSHSWY